MRWGVRDDAQDDHLTTEIVLKEVERCQRLSQGPNFVVCLFLSLTYSMILFILLSVFSGWDSLIRLVSSMNAILW